MRRRGSKTYKLGIIGCGDFVQTWEIPILQASRRVAVKSLFDLNAAKAEQAAARLNGQVVGSADAIFDDPEIDVACIFVPPWVRKELMLRAVAAGKPTLATKPLGSNVTDCAEIVRAVEDSGLPCGVIYGRSGNAAIETLKQIFASGEIGRLALYKQDWIHHYPEWNKWALDPEKNGGPFMDAMVHNLNAARHLMGRPATHCTYFSDNHAHPGLSCNDTEFMKLDFEGGGAVHLFITWAADLEVYDKDKNAREHIDILYMVTDQGWRVTLGVEEGKTVIEASREGETRRWTEEPLTGSFYDRFVVEVVERGGPLPSDLVGVRMAYEDIKLVRDAEQQPGHRLAVDLSFA